MRKLVASLVLALSMFSFNANAELANMYYGLGFSDGNIEVSDSDDMTAGALNATFGFRLYNLLGLELQLGAASDHVDSILSDPLVSYQAAMLRLGYTWNRIEPYLLAGQALISTESTLTLNDSGSALGVGINLYGNKNTALNFHYLTLDDGSFSSATIGFQHIFGSRR